MSLPSWITGIGRKAKAEEASTSDESKADQAKAEDMPDDEKDGKKSEDIPDDEESKSEEGKPDEEDMKSEGENPDDDKSKQAQASATISQTQMAALIEQVGPSLAARAVAEGMTIDQVKLAAIEEQLSASAASNDTLSAENAKLKERLASIGNLGEETRIDASLPGAQGSAAQPSNGLTPAQAAYAAAFDLGKVKSN